MGQDDLDFLKEARKSRGRHRTEAQGIVLAGTGILASRGSRLGKEQWNVREQVFCAALDTNELEVCASLLAELEKQFPESQRVQRLRGLLLEAQGETKEASKLYDKMLEVNQDNMLAMKRKICLLKATNKLNDAIKQLIKYLETYQADSEGWKALAALYAEAGLYKQTSYCLEEVILCNPFSYVSYLAYAESLYTVGATVNNLLDARKYYCQSSTMKKSPENIRALFGLAVTTKAIGEHVETSSATNKKGKGRVQVDSATNEEINTKSIEMIQSIGNMPAGIAELVKKVADQLSVKNRA